MASFAQLPVVSVINEEDRHKAIDLVFLAEGFTANQMGDYRKAVHDLVGQISDDESGIIARHPGLFNFYRVENASATDRLFNASRDDTSLRGCLRKDDPGFSNDWLLQVDDAFAIAAARQIVPEVDAVIVITNLEVGRANTEMSSLFGGGGAFRPRDEVVPAVIALQKTDDGRVLTHELGHALAGLGDEYSESAQSYPEETPQTSVYRSWFGDRLVEIPNLSLDPTGAKWQPLVTGAQEGGMRYQRGISHPTGSCRMRREADPRFCPVCSDAIDQVLAVREGANDGPPSISLALTEPADQVFYSLTIGLTAFDRNTIASVAATVDGQSWITSVSIAPDGHLSLKPDVLRHQGPDWLFYARIDEGYAIAPVPAGDHVLEVTVTDGLGVAATRTVLFHSLRDVQ